MDGLGNAFGSFFNGLLVFLVVCFIVAVLGVGYALYDWIYGGEEIVTAKKIVPEMKLIIKDNKVDTLYVYKLKK